MHRLLRRLGIRSLRCTRISGGAAIWLLARFRPLWPLRLLAALLVLRLALLVLIAVLAILLVFLLVFLAAITGICGVHQGNLLEGDGRLILADGLGRDGADGVFVEQCQGTRRCLCRDELRACCCCRCMAFSCE